VLQAIASMVLAAIGWALCGATVAVGRKITTLRNALIAHAVAAPIIFVVVSAGYYRLFAQADPAAMAGVFTAVVVLDVAVVAPLVERSFDMFRSILGTWVPFAAHLHGDLAHGGGGARAGVTGARFGELRRVGKIAPSRFCPRAGGDALCCYETVGKQSLPTLRRRVMRARLHHQPRCCG